MSIQNSIIKAMKKRGMFKDILVHDVVWNLKKYDSTGELFSDISIKDNVLLTEGITALQNLLIGGAETAFNNANSYIGVGDSSTAESAAHTGLQASTNKLYKAMDATYPLIVNQTTKWQTTFGTSEANFAWNEFTVASGNSDASDNLNRKVSAQGTKTAGQTWVLQLQVTWS